VAYCITGREDAFEALLQTGRQPRGLGGITALCVLDEVSDEISAGKMIGTRARTGERPLRDEAPLLPETKHMRQARAAL
jgi:hypothetical protein